MLNELRVLWGEMKWLKSDNTTFDKKQQLVLVLDFKITIYRNMIITQRTNFKEQNDFKSVLVQASILFVNLELSPKEFDMLTLKTEDFCCPLCYLDA